MVLAACRLSFAILCSDNAFMEADPLVISPVSELDIIWLHWSVCPRCCAITLCTANFRSPLLLRMFEVFYFFVREQDLSSLLYY